MGTFARVAGDVLDSSTRSWPTRTGPGDAPQRVRRPRCPSRRPSFGAGSRTTPLRQGADRSARLSLRHSVARPQDPPSPQQRALAAPPRDRGTSRAPPGCWRPPCPSTPSPARDAGAGGSTRCSHVAVPDLGHRGPRPRGGPRTPRGGAAHLTPPGPPAADRPPWGRRDRAGPREARCRRGFVPANTPAPSGMLEEWPERIEEPGSRGGSPPPRPVHHWPAARCPRRPPPLSRRACG
ncbi:hypothetical protein QJS66_22360 [Kocuria rhizophila]|nr:hypothetical protein QJS66_22360 [Kocuria rhizophila]